MSRRDGRDLRRELEEFDGEYPEAWRPSVGDILVGEVMRWSSGYTDYGEYPICIVRADATGEEVGVWLLHTVLRDEMAKKKPRPGEKIGIKRLPDASKGYKRYAVRVDRDEPEIPNFERFAEPGDVAPKDREELRREARDFDEGPASRGEELFAADDLPF